MRTFLGSIPAASLLLAAVPAQAIEPSMHGAIEALSQICQDPTTYANRSLVLRGVFKGWRVNECKLPQCAGPSMTRSDWLFGSNTECLYVTGARPRVDWLDPVNSDAIDSAIELQAIVQITKDGHVILLYEDAHPVGE